jgi:7-carboxy-7-deazaguanine synthase
LTSESQGTPRPHVYESTERTVALPSPAVRTDTDPEDVPYSTHLPVNEHFGPVIQGEGPYCGRRASFIRLGHCNLHCPPCDTKPTWDTDTYDLAQTCPPTPVREVIRATLRRYTPLVIISGGEPLIWQQTPAWETLLKGLHEGGPIQVHVETNGTIIPTDATRFMVTHFSVSPKITETMGGADPEKRRIKPEALASFAQLAGAGNACLKIVCATPADVDAAAHFADDHGFRRDHVWIMPEGATHEEASATAARIGQHAVNVGANFSPRLHLMMGVR